jgi:hypothetical protein
MTTVETKPYEILIRLKDGEQFAHKQDIAIVKDGDTIVAENILPAESLSIEALKELVASW